MGFTRFQCRIGPEKSSERDRCLLRRWLPAVPAWAVALSGASASASNYGELSPERVEQLLAGEIVVSQIEREEHSYVHGEVYVPSGPEIVWRVMRNCSATIEMVPQIRECRMDSADGDQAIVHHRIKLAWFLPSMDYSFRASFMEGNRIVFEYIEGDFNDLGGEWLIQRVPRKDGSIISLSMRLEPGMLVPRSLVNAKLREHLPKVLTRLRTQVSECEENPARIEELGLG